MPIVFDNEKPKKNYTPLQAKAKAEAYCAYQERCQQEVRDKLYEWGLYSQDVEQIISDLISAGFINEERFAKTFAGSKFRQKQWGRVKIKISLKQKRLSDYCIKKGLAEIDQETYWQTLLQLIEKKGLVCKETNPYKRQHQIVQYAISRGFESDLVWEALKSKDS